MNLTAQEESVGSLKGFESVYKQAHGYIAVTICVFGIAMNLCNIYILTRKSMRSSSTNIILAALASCDIITEIVYLPFAVYFYIVTDTDPLYKYHQIGWIYYAVISLNITHVTHTAALWLTVSLATFRFISVCQHTKANRLCSVGRAQLTVVLVVIASILFCIPSFLCYGIVEVPAGDTQNRTVTWMGETNLCQNEGLKFVAHVAFGGVIKCCACTILIYFTCRLLISLHEAKKRRENLMRNSSSGEKKSEHRRTTAMLTAVALCFVLTEFPQGVLVVVASADTRIFNSVYVYLADFLDDLVLLNSSVNFILYTTMSQKFREMFYSQLIQPVINIISGAGQSGKDKHVQYHTEKEMETRGQGDPLLTAGQKAKVRTGKKLDGISETVVTVA